MATKIIICDAKFTPEKVLMFGFKFNRDVIDAVKAIDLTCPHNIRYGGDWTVKLTADNLPRVEKFIRDFKATVCQADRVVIRQWMDEIRNAE